MNEDFSQSLDRLKESFLFAAAQGGNVQDCDALIEIGADINWKGPGGDTPLLSACRRGHIETVALLLAHGADPNVPGGDSLAPLHVATRRGDHALLNILMEANVNTTLKTRDGQSAMEIARSKGFDDIYAMLAQQISGSGEFDVMQPRRQAASSRSGQRDRSTGNEPNRQRPISRPLAPTSTSSDGNKPQNLPSLPSIVSPRLIVDSSMDYGVNMNLSPRGARNQSVRLTNESISTASKPVISNNGSNPLENGAPPNGVQSTQKYALINSRTADNPGTMISSANNKAAAAAVIASMDETAIALQTLLSQEQRERKVLEGKLQALKDQVLYLTSELQATKSELEEKTSERQQLVGALDLLRGSSSALAALTISQCEQLEVQLRSSLDAVENRKATLIQQDLEKQKEQRLCIVCQERDKCVVLLPCRHMCLCEQCSEHQLLDHCPLCRRPIAHKISVFS